MTAATVAATAAWGGDAAVPGLAGPPAGLPTVTRRPRLRLVPTGDAVATTPPSRLSRRGHLAVAVLVTAVLLTAAVSLLSGGGPAPMAIDHATTVTAGQTLSEVAAAQLPDLPVSQAITRIQLANGLNTTQVHAGQTLLIPALP